MAVYALTSVAGAPGVTTTALAWAALSPRPTMIVEADVTGGSPILAGAFDGTAVHRSSILALASVPETDWVETIWRNAVVLPEQTDRWVLPAIGRGAQARALSTLWRPLANVLAAISTDTGVDVLIDAGRLGTAGGAWDLIAAADAVLVLSDSTIPALTTLTLALPALRADLDLTGSHQRLGVVPIIGPSTLRRSGPAAWLAGAEPDIRPYTRAEIAAAIAPTALVKARPYEPRAAATYAHALPLPRHESAYERAVKSLAVAVETHAHAYRSLLDPTQETRP